MSDAAKNVEIEDVLASIRRLVTTDAGKSARAAPQTEASASPESDMLDPTSAGPALVLTEALRVRPEPAQKAASAEPEPEEAKTADAPIDLSSYVAPTPASDTEGAAADNTAPDRSVHPSAADNTDDASDNDRRSGAQTGPEILASVPDLSDKIPHAGGVSPKVEEEPAPLRDPFRTPDIDQQVSRLETLLSRTRSPKANAQTRMPDVVEPEAHGRASEPTVAPSSRPDSDAVFAEDHAEDLTDAFEFEDDMGSLFASDLDEDQLRDLVAVLVREELRGAFGEQITRNLRKLVRREVHRALASRELD